MGSCKQRAKYACDTRDLHSDTRDLHNNGVVIHTHTNSVFHVIFRSKHA